MKLWLSKNSEIPVRVQLAEQILLGIASGDLQPDEKLPSTRELARRFGIHQNTVSGVYRSLAEQGHLENRKGSGVFVAKDTANGFGRPRLEDLFADFIRRAKAVGYSADEIETHLRNAVNDKPPRCVLVIESDAALRDILIEEIKAFANVPTRGVSFEEFASCPEADGHVIVAMFDERPKLQPLLPSDTRSIFLNSTSVPESIAGQERPQRDELIAVVSGWERFLVLAQVYLLAAKIEPEMIVSRNTGRRDWRNAIKHARLIICDTLTARTFSNDPRVRTFNLVSAASLEEVRSAAAKFKAG